jgi:hypothetical protein
MRGGYRPNAGRKKGYSTIEAEKARELIVRTLAESLEPIVKSLIKLAKKGDIHAVKELFDRAYGRPPQAQEYIEDSRQIPSNIIVISSESQERYGLLPENAITINKSIADKNFNLKQI